MAETKEKISTNHCNCPSCGGIPEFDPQKQCLICPYCNTVVNVAKNDNLEEQSVADLLANTAVWTETEVVECANCGSREVISKGELCTNCPFCGTTNIVKTSEIVGMKPHGICTFQKTLSDATEQAKTWAKKQWFTPNAFKKSVNVDNIKGIYSPSFTFDCDTTTTYEGRLGDRRTSGFGDNKKTYTHYFKISGTFPRKFDDLLIHTSQNIPPLVMQELEPFPTSEASQFDEKLLTGYTASTSAKDGQTVVSDFEGRSAQIIKKEILSKYHYDFVDYFHPNTIYTNRTFKHLLLPVYVGHYKYKNKNYNFYVNGCTGKVSGKTPKSGIKILLFILSILGIALPIILTLLDII